MSLLLESIMVYNRQMMHLTWHEQRFRHTMRSLFGIDPKNDLQSLIKIPSDCPNGLVKCRFMYGPESFAAEFLPYHQRSVASLKIVSGSTIEYSFKFLDRQNLTQLFEQRGTCDDIIIVKDGMLTDSYYANLVFYDGSEWVTPDAPLLAGTQRARLLNNKSIRVGTITLDNFRGFEKVGLINALNDLSAMPQLPVGNIQM